ncbi:MAG TPA: epoxyqueuosine reductase QueH [Thermoleophilia bacterium]|nr:epoxyqueuosine reductase QueH [Thermoleophilia bacterium]
MSSTLLHACCGPCSTVAVPAWRELGVEPVAWFENPNIQPAAERERRRESMVRYSRAAALELILSADREESEGWLAWRTGLAHAGPDERCVACLGLRLDAAGAAARELGFARFSTTLTVSPYQRHDIIVAAGETAADRHGVDFIYVDARDRFRTSYAESRRLGLYRQPYCGCAASKWEAWHARRSRRARRA